MELEDLKKGWKEMEARIDQLEGELKMERHKRTLSISERLVRKYRILGIICILTPCLFHPMMGMAQFSDRTACLFTIFFIIVAIDYIWQSVRIGQLDLGKQSLKETLIKFHREEKLFNLLPLYRIVLAIPILLSIVKDLENLGVTHAMYCIWGGLLMGVLFGLNLRRRFKRDYTRMRKALEEEVGE